MARVFQINWYALDSYYILEFLWNRYVCPKQRHPAKYYPQTDTGKTESFGKLRNWKKSSSPDDHMAQRFQDIVSTLPRI